MSHQWINFTTLVKPQLNSHSYSAQLRTLFKLKDFNYSASKNTDSSVFYTEIEAKILNTDSDPKNTDRDPIIRVIAIQQIIVTLRWKSKKLNANL